MIYFLFVFVFEEYARGEKSCTIYICVSKMLSFLAWGGGQNITCQFLCNKPKNRIKHRNLYIWWHAATLTQYKDAPLGGWYICVGRHCVSCTKTYFISYLWLGRHNTIVAVDRINQLPIYSIYAWLGEEIKPWNFIKNLANCQILWLSALCIHKKPMLTRLPNYPPSPDKMDKIVIYLKQVYYSEPCNLMHSYIIFQHKLQCYRLVFWGKFGHAWQFTHSTKKSTQSASSRRAL